MFRLMIATILTLLSSMADAENYVTVGASNFSSGGSAVNPGDVYGEFTVRIDPYDGSTIATQLELLSRAIVGKYQNRTGSYLLTLEALRGDARILTIPLVSITYDEKTKFIIFKVSEKTAKEVTVNGLIRITEPITYDNNEIQVVLRSYYKKESTFDLSVIDLFNALQKDYSLLSGIDPTGVAGRVIGSVKDTLEQSLRQSEEVESVFRYGMKFAQLADTSDSLYRDGWVNVDFGVREKTGPQKNGRIRISLRAWSKSSIFRYTVEDGHFKFVEPLSSVILNSASLSRDIAIFKFIRESGPADVRNFLDAILSPEGYKGENAETECIKVLSSYRQFLSNRDSMALFWATLQEYRFKFKQAKAFGCISQRRDEFETYGLPVSELEKYFKE